MTLGEAFNQGANKVGNLIILEGGQSFLIGDATTTYGPSSVVASSGWDGWLGKTVVHIIDLLPSDACAILERFKQQAAIPAAPPKDQTDVPQITSQG